jgi:hypothetical protein
MTDLLTIERREYDALRARLQELEDIVHANRVVASIESGESEALPAEMVERLTHGESPVLVWREHRGLSRRELAVACTLSEAVVIAAEASPECLSLADATLLARALAVDVDDLAPLSRD